MTETKEKHPNKKLKRERELRGWSQLKLAELVGTDNPNVSRWENGHNQPNRHFQTELCKAFGKNSEELGFMDEPEVMEEKHEHANAKEAVISNVTSKSLVVQHKQNNTTNSSLSKPSIGYTLEAGIASVKEVRRSLLQYTLNLAGSAVIAPNLLFEPTSLERLVGAFSSPSKVDDVTLSNLETIARSHWHLFLHTFSKSDLLDSFCGHLQTVLHFLKYPQSGTIRNRLYSVASESAQMIGEVLFDMHEYQNAQQYYNFSIYAAKEAGNNVLRAVGLGRLSFLPIYRNEPGQAYPLLQEAKQLIAYISRPAIDSWLAVVEAEAMAHLHDEIACEKALERAMTNYHQGISEEDECWTRLNDATIPGYRGACYLQLKKPQNALNALRETLIHIPKYSLRHQSLILSDIAAAMQQMNQIEEACNLLHDSLRITEHTKSLMVLTRIQRVRKNLDTWKNTVYVKRLDNSINELLPKVVV